MENTMSIFPDKIKVIITNTDTGKPIPNIAVSLSLFAKHKNNYYPMLPISNNSGIIEFDKEWINGKIFENRSIFVMDYSSDLEDCYPKFEFEIPDNEAIKRAIKAKTAYKKALKIPQKDIDALSNVDNYKYIPISKVIELHGDENIIVELKLKELE
jgi:hypothetical protein